jgi:hypothetical protein
MKPSVNREYALCSVSAPHCFEVARLLVKFTPLLIVNCVTAVPANDSYLTHVITQTNAQAAIL